MNATEISGSSNNLSFILKLFLLISSSGYADRIHELMLISRELSADDKKSSLQRAGSRNYLTEANYVEFSGVKVFEMILNHL